MKVKMKHYLKVEIKLNLLLQEKLEKKLIMKMEIKINIINKNENINERKNKNNNDNCSKCFGLNSNKENPLIFLCNCNNYIHYKCVKRILSKKDRRKGKYKKYFQKIHNSKM